MLRIAASDESLVADRRGVSQQSDNETLRFYINCAILFFGNFIVIRLGITLNDTIHPIKVRKERYEEGMYVACSTLSGAVCG